MKKIPIFFVFILLTTCTSAGSDGISMPTVSPALTTFPEPAISLVPVPDNNYYANIDIQPDIGEYKIPGYLQDGQMAIYLFTAAQGQVLSVSIAEGSPYKINIQHFGGEWYTKGLDSFSWRGVLPGTGTYVIQVTSQISGSFTLQIVLTSPTPNNK